MDEDIVKLAAMAGGAAQPFILKQYVFKGNDTVLVPQMGQYGKTSSVVNMAASGVAIAAALVGKYMHKGLTRSEYQDIALSYGVPALTTGLLLDFMGCTTPATGMMVRGGIGGMSAPSRMGARPMRSMSAPVVVNPGHSSRRRQDTAEAGVY